jgi:hypothetical protein
MKEKKWSGEEKEERGCSEVLVLIENKIEARLATEKSNPSPTLRALRHDQRRRRVNRNGRNSFVLEGCLGERDSPWEFSTEGGPANLIPLYMTKNVQADRYDTQYPRRNSLI